MSLVKNTINALKNLVGIKKKNAPKSTFKMWLVRTIIVLLGASLIPLAFGDFSSMRMSNGIMVKVGKIDVPNSLIVRQFQYLQGEANQDIRTNPFIMQTFYMQILQIARNTLFINEANTINLGADRDTMYAILARSPQFQSDGTFDKEAFASWIDNNYQGIRAYMSILGDEVKREQLVGSILIDTKPNFYSKILDQSRRATRNIDYMVVDFNSVQVDNNIDDAELTKYLKANEIQYAKPEYRSAHVIFFNPNQLPNIAISESELMQYYKDNQSLYQSAEMRDISRINFSEKSDAVKAYLEITKNNESLSNYDVIDMGKVSSNDLPSDMSRPVFKMPVGNYQEPIKTTFGYDIFIVKKVYPPQTIPFADVKKDIAKTLETNKKDEQTVEEIKNVEDEIFSGKSFTEIAAKNPAVSIITVPVMDKASRIKDSTQKFNNVAITGNMMNELFNQPKDYATPLKESGNSQKSMYSIKVIDIQPEYVPSLNDLRAVVTKDYIENKKRQLSYEKALSIQKNIIANKDSISNYPTKSMVINRQNNTDFSNNFIEAVFISISGTPILGDTKNGYVIAISKSVGLDRRSLTKDEITLNNNITMLTEDILQKYVINLESKYPVKINSKAIEENFGLGESARAEPNYEGFVGASSN